MKRVVSKMPKSGCKTAQTRVYDLSSGFYCNLTGVNKMYKDKRAKDFAYKHHQRRCEHCAKFDIDPVPKSEYKSIKSNIMLTKGGEVRVDCPDVLK